MPFTEYCRRKAAAKLAVMRRPTLATAGPSPDSAGAAAPTPQTFFVCADFRDATLEQRDRANTDAETPADPDEQVDI